MELDFTQNFLIKYLYKETSASETLAIEEALFLNSKLNEEYQGLLKAYRQLPKVKFSPTSSTIQQILGYSERTALEKSA